MSLIERDFNCLFTPATPVTDKVGNNCRIIVITMLVTKIKIKR